MDKELLFTPNLSFINEASLKSGLGFKILPIEYYFLTLFS